MCNKTIINPTAASRRAEAIVDQLEQKFADVPFDGLDLWDHDEARQLIAAMIPLSDAEREEELDAMLVDVAQASNNPREDSPLMRLKKALRAEGLSLKCVMEAAIEKIQEAEQLRSKTIINPTAVIDLVERITNESPIRRWIAEEDPALGLEQRNVREVPEEWWDELCELLGVE